MHAITRHFRKRFRVHLAIETRGHVVLFTVLATILATAAPLLVVSLALSQIAALPMSAFVAILVISGAIPLLITPPIAYFALTMFRLITLTIKRVDDHVRFDTMTGLLNRDHFLDQLRGCLEGGVVLIVDADHFKSINDRFGHDTGDAALKMLAQQIGDVAGPIGIAGRLGGEEFGVYLPSWSIEQSAVVADAICSHIRLHTDRSTGHDLRMTVSIGGAAHFPGAMIREALKSADDRLYHAKETGRDRFVLADPVVGGRFRHAA